MDEDAVEVETEEEWDIESDSVIRGTDWVEKYMVKHELLFLAWEGDDGEDYIIVKAKDINKAKTRYRKSKNEAHKSVSSEAR